MGGETFLNKFIFVKIISKWFSAAFMYCLVYTVLLHCTLYTVLFSPFTEDVFFKTLSCKKLQDNFRMIPLEYLN